MEQTKTEKELEKALEALKRISLWDLYPQEMPMRDFATKIHAELTAPEVEQVEVKVWKCKTCETYCCVCAEQLANISGFQTYFSPRTNQSAWTKTEYARDVDIGTVATMRVVQQSVSLP